MILLFLYNLRYYDKPVYLSKQLAPHEWQIEKQLLKARKNLLEMGDLSKNYIRINNLELQRRERSDWVKVNSE